MSNYKHYSLFVSLQVPLQLPKILSWSISREEERKKRQLEAKEAKRKKLQMAWEVGFALPVCAHANHRIHNQ